MLYSKISGFTLFCALSGAETHKKNKTKLF